MDYTRSNSGREMPVLNVYPSCVYETSTPNETIDLTTIDKTKQQLIVFPNQPVQAKLKGINEKNITITIGQGVAIGITDEELEGIELISTTNVVYMLV